MSVHQRPLCYISATCFEANAMAVCLVLAALENTPLKGWVSEGSIQIQFRESPTSQILH